MIFFFLEIQDENYNWNESKIDMFVVCGVCTIKRNDLKLLSIVSDAKETTNASNSV